MDRRQKKTRAAIFYAFTELLAKKPYGKITTQEIIDRADVGRSTFYAHFETKEDLLRVFCEELFQHVLDSAADHGHTHGLYSNDAPPHSVFCHILQHLQKNDRNILLLLGGENCDIFLRHFKNYLNDLVRQYVLTPELKNHSVLPTDFLVNHISSSFVEMVLWWIKNGKKETPEQLDGYFQALLPIPRPPHGI